MSDAETLFSVLRQSADGDVVSAIEALVRDAPDHALARVNTLDFAHRRGLGEEQVIAAFLHAARLGLFEMSWNVLCPSCGGVLDANATLKSVRSAAYHCAFCAISSEPTLDDLVEVTFMVNPRLRRIAAHEPDTLSSFEYLRQIFFSSGVDLPDDADARFQDITFDAVELPPGDKAILSLHVPEGSLILFDPVTHATQFMTVTGEPVRERQGLTVIFNDVLAGAENVTLQPGPLRLSFENRSSKRVLPLLLKADERLHQLLDPRRPALTAKRLLTNQTFRDVYGTDTLDIEQRLKITSLTFLFTDLKESTSLYERVGDLAAYDLVRAHFQVLNGIVAAESGAVVKTIGDAVMATFPTPERAVAAAIRMREAMQRLGAERQRQDLTLKIGIHEGPCLAVVLNDRQDYFGQTVNIASRVQGLAESRSIFASGTVVDNPSTTALLKASGLVPTPQRRSVQGLSGELAVYEIP
ncbi:adenylate/guanylate cyclase domain-containing protein [Vineibacter terrae]|uniref:Adenylate/guanylate cyclase domain-containing protein n=1 Tax=Vineibacter terrae TaxID=2586908 RepID=A0A5C8PEL5_9HYPH|nr:adenylate/guanylate cyclase domain-containing protein [Vineibacter terrae]TXL72238.1 adenylate/guanylate cyclase domain-containing protein [Vineibacter terrae]